MLTKLVTIHFLVSVTVIEISTITFIFDKLFPKVGDSGAWGWVEIRQFRVSQRLICYRFRMHVNPYSEN